MDDADLIAINGKEGKSLFLCLSKPVSWYGQLFFPKSFAAQTVRRQSQRRSTRQITKISRSNQSAQNHNGHRPFDFAVRFTVTIAAATSPRAVTIAAQNRDKPVPPPSENRRLRPQSFLRCSTRCSKCEGRSYDGIAGRDAEQRTQPTSETIVNRPHPNRSISGQPTPASTPPTSWQRNIRENQPQVATVAGHHTSRIRKPPRGDPGIQKQLFGCAAAD